MKKVQKCIRLDPQVAELHETISSLGGINSGKVVEALTYMLVDKHGVAELLDYITTLEFMDGRKKDG